MVINKRESLHIMYVNHRQSLKWGQKERSGFMIQRRELLYWDLMLKIYEECPYCLYQLPFHPGVMGVSKGKLSGDSSKRDRLKDDLLVWGVAQFVDIQVQDSPIMA